MKLHALLFVALLVALPCTPARSDIILDNVDPNAPPTVPSSVPLTGPTGTSKPAPIAPPTDMLPMVELSRKHDQFVRTLARWTWKPRLVLPTTRPEDLKQWYVDGGKLEILPDNAGLKVVTTGKNACWVTYIGKEPKAGQFKGAIGVTYEAMTPKDIRPCDLSVRLMQLVDAANPDPNAAPAAGANAGGVGAINIVGGPGGQIGVVAVKIAVGGPPAVVGPAVIAPPDPAATAPATAPAQLDPTIGAAEVLLFQLGGWHNAQNLFKVNGEAHYQVGGPLIDPGKWQKVEITYGPSRATGLIGPALLMDEALKTPVADSHTFLVSLYVYDSTGIFRNVTILGPGDKPDKRKLWTDLLGTTTEDDLKKIADQAAAKLGDGSFRVREAATEVLYNLRTLSADALKKALDSKDPETHSRALDVAKKIGLITEDPAPAPQ